MYCKYCNKYIDDNSHYCKYCGNKTSIEEELADTPIPFDMSETYPPLPANSATSEELANCIEDEFGVLYSEDGTKLLKCKNENLREYSIIKGTKVICDNAFHANLKEVFIPSSVVSIGENAFVECVNLTKFEVDEYNKYYCSIEGVLYSYDKTLLIRVPQDYAFYRPFEIPQTVSVINHHAFYQCKGLKEIFIHKRITSIGERALFGCSKLKELIIPDNVTYIGKDALSECYGLISLTIGNSVTYLGGKFEKCRNLKYVTIGNSVIEIEDKAFRWCEKLERVDIGDGVTKIGYQAFAYCINLRYILLPNRLTTIGNSVFANCCNLEEITLPKSVTSIGYNLFWKCWSLTRITSLNPIPPTCDSHIASTRMNLDICVLYVPKGSKDLYLKNSKWRGFGTTMELNEWGFYPSHDSPLSTKVYQSDIDLAEKDEYGALYSRYNNKRLLSIKNNEIEEYSISEGTKVICDRAFNDCPNLKKINIPNGVTIIGCYAFCYCSNLLEIIIPDSVTMIREMAFFHHHNLTHITFGNSLAIIGKNAFEGCSSIKELTIPSSVTYIGLNAFYGCMNLWKVVFNDGITILEYGIFEGCSRLVEINIPNSVIIIDNHVFYNCRELPEIIIPQSVIEIGEHAFYNCEKLTSITSLNPNPPMCGKEAFTNIPPSCILYVPKGSKDVYSTADEWSGFTNIEEV